MRAGLVRKFVDACKDILSLRDGNLTIEFPQHNCASHALSSS